MAPFLQPQLSARSGASTSAFEHKQRLVGGPQGLKLPLIVCTNHRPRKKWFEKPLTFLFTFCYKNYCNFLVLVRGQWWETLSPMVSPAACSRPMQDVLVLLFASR